MLQMQTHTNVSLALLRLESTPCAYEASTVPLSSTLHCCARIAEMKPQMPKGLIKSIIIMFSKPTMTLKQNESQLNVCQ